MKLEISYRGGTTHEVELTGGVAVLGRDPGCDVVLNDAKCSRRHAVVEDGPRGLVVKDTGSANGVYLNGRRVDEAPLRPGDVLRLGDVRVKVLAEVGETVVIAPEDLDLSAAADGLPPHGPDLPLRDAPAPAPPRLERTGPSPRPPAERRRASAASPGGPRRPATVSVLVALWALFVPASVAACVLAVQRLGGGAVAWTLGAAVSVLLAGLGTSMALGLRVLAPWARQLQVATAALGLLACPFTLASATVLLYMTRPEVKAAFGAGPRAPGGGDGAAEATFALSLVGMLALGMALTAIVALVL